MAEPLPLILTDASLKIDGTELACLANHIELTPDVTITTLDTMCGSRDYPGTVKWSLLATLYQSFDADATEEVLSAAVDGGVPVPFEILGVQEPARRRDQPEVVGRRDPAALLADQRGRRRRLDGRARVVADRRAGQETSRRDGPPPVDIKIKGIKQLESGARRLFENIEDAEASDAIMPTAEQVAGTVRARVPRKTGRLAGSVHVEQRGNVGQVRWARASPYARWIEYGGGRGRPYRKSGRYLLPTARRTTRAFRKHAEQVCAQQIRRMSWPTPR